MPKLERIEKTSCFFQNRSLFSFFCFFSFENSRSLVAGVGADVGKTDKGEGLVPKLEQRAGSCYFQNQSLGFSKLIRQRLVLFCRNA